MTTAWVTFSPRYASAVSFILVRTIALISSGVKSRYSPLYSTVIAGFPALLLNLERPVLHVALDVTIVHFTTNETLRIEDGVSWVGVEGVLGAVTNKAFIIGEGDPRRCDTVTLVVVIISTRPPF